MTTPTEALKEWARETSKDLALNLGESCSRDRRDIEAAILSGVVKGLEAAKVKAHERAVLDALPEDEFEVAVHRFGTALVEDIDALLKALSDSEAPERSEDLKERTT